jgi:hypothetical protein
MSLLLHDEFTKSPAFLLFVAVVLAKGAALFFFTMVSNHKSSLKETKRTKTWV